jgi:ABC-type multidrug transport system fused ATPase/permease subunit
MVKRLIGYLRPVWIRFSVALVCMTLVAAVSTSVVWLMKFLIDNAIAQKDLETLHIGVVALITVIFLKSILWYTHTYLASLPAPL